MNVRRGKLDFGKILTNTAGLAAGGVGGKLVIKKIAPNLDPKLKAIAVIALGAVLPEMSRRSPMLASVGNGMAAVGGAELVGAFVPGLAGIYDEFDDFDESIGQDEYDLYEDNEDNEDNDNAIGADG